MSHLTVIPLRSLGLDVVEDVGEIIRVGELKSFEKPVVIELDDGARLDVDDAPAKVAFHGVVSGTHAGNCSPEEEHVR